MAYVSAKMERVAQAIERELEVRVRRAMEIVGLE